MRKVAIFLGLLCLVLANSLFFSAIPFVHAGQFSVNSGLIYGTEVSCSVSYPDNFRFIRDSFGVNSEYGVNDIMISLSIGATFDNQSISGVSILEVFVGLYPLGQNLTQVAYSGGFSGGIPALGGYDAYANGEMLAGGLTGVNITGSGVGTTASASIGQIPVFLNSEISLGNNEPANLFIEVAYCYLSPNGVQGLVWRNAGDYIQYLYTNNGEAPQVTVYYTEAQQSPISLSNPFFVIGVLAVVIIIILAVVLGHTKKKNCPENRQNPKTQHHRISLNGSF